MSILDDLPKSVRDRNPGLAAKRASSTKSGRTAQARGSAWENDVEGALDSLMFMLADRTVEHYRRTDARKVERGGQVIARIPTGCDYLGILAQRHGGLGFVIECKSGDVIYATKEHAALARHPRAPAITPEQRKELDAYMRAGCPALLGVRSRGIETLLSWEYVHNMPAIDVSKMPMTHLSVERSLAEHLRLALVGRR